MKGQPCDGISIGIAFDADAVEAPSQVVQSVDAGPLSGCDGGGESCSLSPGEQRAVESR